MPHGLALQPQTLREAPASFGAVWELGVRSSHGKGGRCGALDVCVNWHGPFRSVVDVLREGRGALATSFTSVKFQLMYGQVVCFNKIISYGYAQGLEGRGDWGLARGGKAAVR